MFISGLYLTERRGNRAVTGSASSQVRISIMFQNFNNGSTNFIRIKDHETAMSAVRNLHDHEVGGRRLRIDLADSDPFLEGKTTSHGELVDSGETRAQWRERERQRNGGEGDDPDDKRGFLKSLPPGVPLPPGSTAMDAISTTLASMDPAQLTEVLAQMKVKALNN